MKERVCKNCGGRSYKVVGQNLAKCMFCGTLYVDEHASQEEQFLVVKAYELIREFKFSDAIEEFDKILALYPRSYEALFGKCLAKNKIVLYSNKRGVKQSPKFFGEIQSIKEDKDYISALECAPAEVVTTYKSYARKIDKIFEAYKQISEESDVFVLSARQNVENATIKNIVGEIEKSNNVFLYNNQKEEFVFKALKTSKVFLFLVNSDKNFTNGEIKNIYERYLYFVSEKKRTKASFIVVLDGVEKDSLPKNILINRSLFDTKDVSFLTELIAKIEKEKKTSIKESAKIETVKVETAVPEKVDYVDISTVEPTELGAYEVKNVQLSDESKIKWIFLALKHGDFVSAQDSISSLVQNDPNNSQLLFAQLMVDKRICTEDEFFKNISNFSDKQTIDKILTYASKDFAEEFVNKWEDLLIEINSEDYYEIYLLYLAKYNTSNRERFISAAEKKAIETLDEGLIQKVVKCFDKKDVQRFINFYFELAQKSDNQEFYDRVLELDEGHEQSNLIRLLQNFDTIEQKLSYQNREEFENVLKFFKEDSRINFINSILDLVMPIAFYDVEKACNQLDFYLAYISDHNALANKLKEIALEFQAMGFFKEAEKYLSIAASKAPSADIYWELIKSKAHCKTEQEMILTNVKVTKFPEWDALISLSDDKQTEYYAEIVSKINLYKGQRQAFKQEALDKINLTAKIESFVNRNKKILLDFEGQELSASVEYYKSQLVPFEKYPEKIKEIESFEEYSSLAEKISQRLSALGLSLDSSINVLHLQSKSYAKRVIETKKEQETQRNKKLSELKRDVFLKRFCFLFLELCPLLFIAGLFIFLVVSPKETFLVFNQSFFVVALLISVGLAFLNLIYFVFKRRKETKVKLASYLLVVVLGFINLVMFVMGFYLTNPIEISNAKEMQKLLQNAPHAAFVIQTDIDMKEIKWRASNFSGTLDGNGHSLENLVFKNSSLILNNDGEIKNLTIRLANVDYQSAKFAGLALENTGVIENCSVYGNVSIDCADEAIVAGIASKNIAGKIAACLVDMSFNLSGANEVEFGGIAGRDLQSSIIKNNVVNTKLILNSQQSNLNIGGLIGVLERDEHSDVSINECNIEFKLKGSAKSACIGGLVGKGYQETENCFVVGSIDSSGLAGEGVIGGLFGQYENTRLSENINHCYAIVDIEGEFKKGSLIGRFGGSIDSCFSTVDLVFVAEEIFSQAKVTNCLKFYSQELQFDNEIWDLSGTLPKLK